MTDPNERITPKLEKKKVQQDSWCRGGGGGLYIYKPYDSFIGRVNDSNICTQ